MVHRLLDCFQEPILHIRKIRDTTPLSYRLLAMVDMNDGTQALAEVHWYEAHGIGKVKMKVKRWL